VLFDLKQGFCNYYSSAEIVLLRAAGIPARWAVGYAQGEFDPASGSYQVRQRDAHSWPEVYYPGIGWVEFEPTLSQPVLDRPFGDPLAEGENQNNLDLLNPDANPGLQDQEGFIRGLEEGRDVEVAGENAALANPYITALILVAALALIGISLFAWRTRTKRSSRPLPVLLELGLSRIGVNSPKLLRRWSGLASLAPLPRAYHELNRALSRLGQPPKPFDTPAERGAALSNLLPKAAPQVGSVLDQYQKVTYSLYPGDILTAQVAARSVRNLSWLAWLNKLLSRWQDPRPRSKNSRARF
jgi:hypothetical protein